MEFLSLQSGISTPHPQPLRRGHGPEELLLRELIPSARPAPVRGGDPGRLVSESELQLSAAGTHLPMVGYSASSPPLFDVSGRGWGEKIPRPRFNDPWWARQALCRSEHAVWRGPPSLSDQRRLPRPSAHSRGLEGTQGTQELRQVPGVGDPPGWSVVGVGTPCNHHQVSLVCTVYSGHV